MDDHEVVARARAQHGLITRSQAMSLGASHQAIRTAIRTGRWARLHRGVYVVGAAPSTWEQRVLAACLAAGPDALASHRTAARLLGLVERSGRIELLTDGYRRLRLPGVFAHRTIHLAPEDRTIVRGIPVTSLNRTLIDLSPRQPTETLGRWLDLAMLRGQVDLSALARRTTELTMPGRPTPGSLMAALALRSPNHDPGRSVLEARIIAALAHRGLPTPVRQHPVIRPDGRQAYIDLAYPAQRIAIEADGWSSHGLRAAFEPDRVRGNELELLGFHLYRFTWTMSDTYICDTVEAALARCATFGSPMVAGQPLVT